MKKIIFVLIILVVGILGFVSAQSTDLISTSCFQSCKKQMEENCVTYPNSAVCPENISRRCELNCKEADFVYLNEDFLLNIGEKTKVKNYDNMEIKLLKIERSRTRKGNFIDSFIADLEIKRGDETKFISIMGKEKKDIFDIRLDFVTILFSYPEGFDSNSKQESLNAAIPTTGVFGIYEKGVGGFWQRVSNFVKRLFRQN